MTNFSRSPTATSFARRLIFGAGAIVCAGTVAAIPSLGMEVPARTPRLEAPAVRDALQKRLPGTQVTAIDCAALGGLCEVTAGRNLFYVDRAARHLIIGRVYDMETRQDLTAARLLELSPDTLAAAGPRAGEPIETEASPRPAKAVPVSALPAAGAISWGPRNGPGVMVFSDFRCPYCARLADELTRLGARVEERPISVLGTRPLSDAVYCASDQVAAMRLAYAGGTPVARRCDTRGLDANERFARAHGFGGTPVMVRADGAVLEGYRPAGEIATWLKGARS